MISSKNTSASVRLFFAKSNAHGRLAGSPAQAILRQLRMKARVWVRTRRSSSFASKLMSTVPSFVGAGSGSSANSVAPRFQHHSFGVANKLLQVSRFLAAPRAQYRVFDVEWCQALINHPGERSDVGSSQITLELHCFMNRRCFRQRDDEHVSELRISQTRQESLHRFRTAARFAQHLTMVRFCRVE